MGVTIGRAPRYGHTSQLRSSHYRREGYDRLRRCWPLASRPRALHRTADFPHLPYDSSLGRGAILRGE